MSRPYKTCPNCGSHLDWGETCDCQNERAPERITGRGGAASAGSSAEMAAREARKNVLAPVLMPGA